ncbi:MAG: hypothetical protein KF799_07105 [Bdellovibrionales bacterium]|nr:hypothetical protein [Bdellovibrionales bacterium]
MKALILCLSLIPIAAAAELDEHQRKGLSDTKKMLVNPSERNEAIKNDKKAKEVDAKVDALAGSPENKEEIYGIAASVMEKITVEAQGDPEKMQRLLLEAQTNPKAFYDKYFTEADKARVRAVSGKIESKKTSMPRK